MPIRSVFLMLIRLPELHVTYTKFSHLLRTLLLVNQFLFIFCTSTFECSFCHSVARYCGNAHRVWTLFTEVDVLLNFVLLRRKVAYRYILCNFTNTGDTL